MEGEATVTPATAAEIASSSVDEDDDAILAELDEQFGKKDEPKEKPKADKPKEAPKKPAPKDDDSDDEDEDEDGEDEKPKSKPKAKPEEDDSDDDDDQDDDKEEGSGKKMPKLHPKTPAEVTKFFQEKWRTWRQVADARDTEHKEAVATFEQEKADFRTWIEKKVSPALQPALRVMKAMEACRKGTDWSLLRTVIEEGTGESLDVGIKKLVQGTKLSASEKRMAEKLAALEAKLAEKDQEQTQAATQAQRAEAETKYLAQLEEELEGHEVTKLKGFAKRVLKVQRKSWDPKLKAFKLGPEEAANKVLRIERKRLAELKALEEGEPEKPKPKDEKESARVFSLDRSGSREGGIPDEDESDEDILRDLDRQFASKRSDERKRAGKRR